MQFNFKECSMLLKNVWDNAVLFLGIFDPVNPGGRDKGHLPGTFKCLGASLPIIGDLITHNRIL